MSKKIGPARGMKWKPNGLAEQALVADEIGKATDLYTAIKEKLRKVTEEAEKLKNQIRPEIGHVENGR